ncbi:hypothetical protein [Novosphingobium arvoryzae]|uniref:Uncharacterized protein n=1 Tax=Novosphingobium arvoryzae TaxID=1256514 RepID=A0A918RIU4_9SPHN|nr:hypothetical protein [Novosphingobium arvoryzae]GGZ99510.1 hypothetical protein GCM10011617_19950 [Novosphingobium arvoryzae]
MATQEFYLARAGEARAEAAVCTLDNVRERALRSAAAWEAMAARAAETAEARHVRDLEKAAAGFTSP